MTLVELRAFLAQALPGATLQVDPETGRLTVQTDLYVEGPDLLSKAERDALYEGDGTAYVIELPYTGLGRERGRFYFVGDGEDYTTDLRLAKRFTTRGEAEQTIDDAGNMMDEDKPRVRVLRE